MLNYYTLFRHIAVDKDSKKLIYGRTQNTLSREYMENNCCIVCERDVAKYRTKFIKLHDEDGNDNLDASADENKYRSLITVSNCYIVIFLIFNIKIFIINLFYILENERSSQHQGIDATSANVGGLLFPEPFRSEAERNSTVKVWNFSTRT